jgi:hypothetical protein
MPPVELRMMVFQILAFEVRPGDLVVQIGDVGLVVLAVVEVDGFGRDMRCQGIAGIGQGGQFDGHGKLQSGSRLAEE